MALHFRPAQAGEYQKIQDMVIDSFEPITWFKKLDTQVGPLNGRGRRTRSQARMRQVFEQQILLVGDTGDGVAALSSETIDQDSALAYIDLLAVAPQLQGRGYRRVRGSRAADSLVSQDLTAHKNALRDHGVDAALSVHQLRDAEVRGVTRQQIRIFAAELVTLRQKV